MEKAIHRRFTHDDDRLRGEGDSCRGLMQGFIDRWPKEQQELFLRLHNSCASHTYFREDKLEALYQLYGQLIEMASKLYGPGGKMLETHGENANDVSEGILQNCEFVTRVWNDIRYAVSKAQMFR